MSELDLASVLLLSNQSGFSRISNGKSYGSRSFLSLRGEILDRVLNRSTGYYPSEKIPETFNISQNYPNPFNPVTTIKYQLPTASKTKLEIYNILGQKVKTLVDAQQPADYYTLRWDGTNNHGTQVGSGLYIYRLIAEAADGSESFVEVKKMPLIR